MLSWIKLTKLLPRPWLSFSHLCTHTQTDSRQKKKGKYSNFILLAIWKMHYLWWNSELLSPYFFDISIILFPVLLFCIYPYVIYVWKHWSFHSWKMENAVAFRIMYIFLYLRQQWNRLLLHVVFLFCSSQRLKWTKWRRVLLRIKSWLSQVSYYKLYAPTSYYILNVPCLLMVNYFGLNFRRRHNGS